MTDLSIVLQCYLFSQCRTTEEVAGTVRSVTGLLPAVQRGEPDSQSPRAARLVDEVRRPVRDCGQTVVGRSCKFGAEVVIRLISTRSMADCEVACRAETACSAFTFHPQGGGGVSLGSPCLVVRDCSETVWCQDCLTRTTHCQTSPPPARPLLALEAARPRPHSSALVVAGGVSPDSLEDVRQVELLGSDGARCYREMREMPGPRSRAVAGAVGGGRVLVCGGREGRLRYSSSCHQLDLTTGEWAGAERMVRGREDAGVSVLAGGRLVVTGGWDGHSLLDSVELHHSDYPAWQEMEGWRLTRARYQHCATALGQTVIIAGGYPTLRLVQALSLEAGGDWQGWTRLQDMRGGRVAHGCAVAQISGRPSLVISGGQSGGSSLSSVESLALTGGQAGTWSRLADLPLARRHHIMTQVGPARLVVAGGQTSQVISLNLEEEGAGWNTYRFSVSPSHTDIKGSSSQD